MTTKAQQTRLVPAHQVNAIIPSDEAGSSSSSSYSLGGTQDLTVIFSRSVIALGSDFGNDEFTSGDQAPFKLLCKQQGNVKGGECDIPGTLRWVTTSIARFTPNNTWPTGMQRIRRRGGKGGRGRREGMVR